MKKFFFLILLPIYLSAQTTKDTISVDTTDLLYREDQFYISLSYNLIQNRPTGFKQFSISPGLTAGFLRDFPITKNRRFAIAPGIGYSYNNIKQFINSDELLGVGSIAPSENIRSIITTHGIEIPIEFRWRNSTPQSHKFWRVYTGFKSTYIFNSKLTVESTSGTEKESISDRVNRWQFGVYVAAGFNTWNPYIYYGINPIFKDGSKFGNLNVGFQFYIL